MTQALAVKKIYQKQQIKHMQVKQASISAAQLNQQLKTTNIRISSVRSHGLYLCRATHASGEILAVTSSTSLESAMVQLVQKTKALANVLFRNEALLVGSGI